MWINSLFSIFFFFIGTATTEIYTLSLHDALPISIWDWIRRPIGFTLPRQLLLHLQPPRPTHRQDAAAVRRRSEEHTSELQSLTNLVCRLLLEKKKNKENRYYDSD